MEIPYSADQIESESESESENGSIDMDFGWRVDHAIMSESGSNLGASPVHSFTSILDNAIRSEAVSIFGSSPVPSFVSAEDNVMTSLFSSAHVNNFSLHNSTANRGNSNTGGRGFAARLFALANWRRRKPLAAACKRFSLRELQRATDNFSYKNFLGSGGFGKVYKGRLADGSLVAVKRLKQQPKQGDDQQFQTEVAIISMIVHRNLLPLRGFCIARNERLLVYPFMVNGSVLSCLRERQESQRPLGWPDRKSIALGSAKGLAYLHDHCEPKIIHRDVKAANIYLDDELEAVVGDFGLAILMNPNDTHVTTVVRGTLGHIAPEYLLTGMCSEKSDVFGYGMMLLELISGQRDFYVARLAKDGNVMLLNWVKGLLKDKKLETLVDADLQGNCNEEEVEKLIQLALLCTQYSPTERPKMSEVVIMLNGIGLAEKWEQYLQKDKIFWLSEIAEQAKRRAEIARLRDLHTLKGHVDSVVKLKGFDIDTIQQHYTV